MGVALSEMVAEDGIPFGPLADGLIIKDLTTLQTVIGS